MIQPWWRLVRALDRQTFAAEMLFNGAGRGFLHAGRFAWIYDSSPSALSRVYRIRIEMDHEVWPDVFVEDPDLGAS